MANKRISSLDDITLVGGTSTAEVNANDILPITDVDDTTGSLQGTTKAVKVSDLMGESPVQSVNTQTGAVVLDADDIDDTSTSHKFVTASDITNLGNLSGTNTGDQDLSSYQLQPSEGAFIDGDKTKLDGIEASADVTDTANVTAAGALMDSEVTNLAQVKAFDSSDYATAAQGSLADTATQPADNVSTLTNDSGYITGVTAGELGDFDFDDNAILGFSASKNDQTGTTYTVVASDNGKVVVLNNASAITVDIDTGLPAGFNCSFVQKGLGQVSFAGTATVNNRQSHTKINGQYGVASIVAYDTDTYILAGDTAS
jgi:hypothetical protein